MTTIYPNPPSEPGESVGMRVLLTGGSSVQYSIQIGNTTHPATLGSGGTLRYTFNTAGVFSVRVTVHNGVSSVTQALPSYIYVQNRVRGAVLVRHSSTKQVHNILLV